MAARAVCLDVMGTLFDLSAARRRLEGLGAPPWTLEAWFGRLLHVAATVTLIGDYRPFPELARPALESVLARLDLPPDGASEVLEALAELDAYPDAAPALERLAGADIPLVALTNGTAQNTRALLERARLDRSCRAGHLDGCRRRLQAASGRVRPCGRAARPPCPGRDACRRPRLGRGRRACRGTPSRLDQPARAALATPATRAARSRRPHSRSRPHPRRLTAGHIRLRSPVTLRR